MEIYKQQIMDATHVMIACVCVRERVEVTFLEPDICTSSPVSLSTILPEGSQIRLVSYHQQTRPRNTEQSSRNKLYSSKIQMIRKKFFNI